MRLNSHKTRAPRSSGSDFWCREQLDSDLSKAVQASLPAGSARRAGGRAGGRQAALLLAGGLGAGSLGGCALPALPRPAARGAARSARHPPAARRGALTLGTAPASSRSCSCSSLSRSPAGSSVSALPGEPPGERQASGRIINHPRPPVPSAR